MSSTSGRSTPSTQPPRNTTNKLVDSLIKARNRGAVECILPNHHKFEYFPATDGSGQTWSRVVRKDVRVLYDSMMPGESAKCACLKSACEAQWGRNFHGRRTTCAIAPGSYTKGLEKDNATPKKVFTQKYTLDKEQFNYLSTTFPDWHFVSRGQQTHDHPIAHTSTRIAAERLLDDLPRGTAAEPKVYVDLNGNPSANEAYCARNTGIDIITIVTLITPRDYVRCATKWGPRMGPTGPRWFEAYITDLVQAPWTLALKGVNGFISINTAYYYNKSEICDLLQVYRCPLYALMHRFTGYYGCINNGEQQYRVFRQGQLDQVIQTNTKTGEAYEHPNNNFWFEHDSLTVGQHGFGWDSHLVTPEIFKFIAVYCPAVQCNMSPRCMNMAGLNDVVLPDTTVSRPSAMSQQDIARSRTVVVELGTTKCAFEIEPQLVPFFGEMRKAVMHRARTAPQFADHVARCKIRSKSLMTDLKLDIDVQRLADIALASFFIDINDQVDAANALMSATMRKTLAADMLYKQGAGFIARSTFRTLTEMLLAAHDAKNVTQAVVRVTRAGIQQLEQRRVL